jgi:predicted metal-dependent hydrolase
MYHPIEEFIDKELGRLLICVNARAKNIIFHTKSDAIYISVPPHITQKVIRDAIESWRDRLLVFRRKISPPFLIDLNFQINAEYFKLSLIAGKQSEKFFVHCQSEGMEIICPPKTNFENEEIQRWLHRVIEEALRKNAKRILPARLSALSEQCGLSYQNVKINSSHGRWGSCSAKKDINLSCYLLLLPQHLIDYVLVHELCHTCEMNHGVLFWKLLNSFTKGKALELRKELNCYKTDITPRAATA